MFRLGEAEHLKPIVFKRVRLCMSLAPTSLHRYVSVTYGDAVCIILNAKTTSRLVNLPLGFFEGVLHDLVLYLGLCKRLHIVYLILLYHFSEDTSLGFLEALANLYHRFIFFIDYELCNGGLAFLKLVLVVLDLLEFNYSGLSTLALMLYETIAIGPIR